MSHNQSGLAAALAATLLFSIAPAFAQSSPGQGTAIAKTFDSGEAVSLIADRCSSCHDWAASRDQVLASGLVVPGKPEESRIWIMIDSGSMPADGSSLDAGQKALIRDWIMAGAPAPSAGTRSPAASSATDGKGAGPLPASSFLGFKSKEDFHRFSGWMSGGVLLAAAGVGTWHLVDMMAAAHAWRDAHYPNMDSFDPAICPAEVAAVYDSPNEQALRWTHVGLLAAGETFYLANAFTGTSFMGKLGPGWSKARIHRYAFFVHAGLMATEGVLGFLSSDALSRGDHDAFTKLLVAHAGIGIAIPMIILGAGTIMDPKVKF